MKNDIKFQLNLVKKKEHLNSIVPGGFMIPSLKTQVRTPQVTVIRCFIYTERVK